MPVYVAQALCFAGLLCSLSGARLENGTNISLHCIPSISVVSPANLDEFSLHTFTLTRSYSHNAAIVTAMVASCHADSLWLLLELPGILQDSVVFVHKCVKVCLVIGWFEKPSAVLR